MGAGILRPSVSRPMVTCGARTDKGNGVSNRVRVIFFFVACDLIDGNRWIFVVKEILEMVAVQVDACDDGAMVPES